MFRMCRSVYPYLGGIEVVLGKEARAPVEVWFGEKKSEAAASCRVI